MPFGLSAIPGVPSAGAVSIAVRPAFGGFQAAMAAGLKGEEAGARARFASFGKAATLGLAAAGVTVAAVSVKMASDFEDSMTKISTQAGGTTKDVEVLSQRILDLGGRVTQSPQELADAMFHLKSVGLDNADAMDALTQAAHFAQVGGSNLEDTTNALAGAWRSGIAGAGNFHDAVGTLNAIIGQGNLRLEDLNAALGTGVLNSARAAGLTLKDVGAALAIMTSQGQGAAQSATRLRMSFSLLAAPSDHAKGILEDIGVNSVTLSDKMQQPGGLIKALEYLKDHLETLPKPERFRALSNAFGGGRSAGAIIGLINNLDALSDRYDKIGKAAGNFDDKLTESNELFSNQMKKLGSTIKTDLVRIGLVLIPILQRIIEWLNKNRWALIALGAVLGTLMVASIAVFVAGMIAVSPVVAAVAAAIAGLVVLGLYFASRWRRISDSFVRFWNTIKTGVGDAIGYLLQGFRNLLAGFIHVAGGIVDAAAKAFGWIPGIGSKIRDFQKQFHQTTDDVLAGLDRQISRFHGWGEASEGSIHRVSTAWGQMRTAIERGINPAVIRGAPQPIGDGFGAGNASRMARAAMAAVPGPQYISSGYRSPAQNRAAGGAPQSFHMDRANPAQDIAGTNLMGVFSYLASHFRSSIRELFYDPAGYYIKNGRAIPGAIGGHSDHVHVADLGGVFKGPGYVRMGAGYETFAGGLARKVEDVRATPPIEITVPVILDGEVVDERVVSIVDGRERFHARRARALDRG